MNIVIKEYEYLFPEDSPIDDYHLDERWADLENGYFVSDWGRIYSTKSNRCLKPKRLDKHGHVGLSYRENGKVVYKYLHRLIAKEFLPNPDNLPVVRHLDDDPTNNVVDNLAWGTQQDNMQDCIENGNAYTITDDDREKGFEKIRVPIISKNLKTGEEKLHRSINDAARELGLWSANIQKVLYGERKHTGGYYFERRD